MEMNQIIAVGLLIAFTIMCTMIFQLLEAQKTCEPERERAQQCIDVLSQRCVGTCVSLCMARNVSVIQ